jgi:PqqD family protein of HPr-rel-A system
VALTGRPGGRRWALTDPRGTRVAVFGDACMVFNPLSWETHYASTHVAEILGAIAAGHDSDEALFDELVGADGDESERPALLHLVDGLSDLGLIRSVG